MQIRLILIEQLAQELGYSGRYSSFRDSLATIMITPVLGRRGWFDPLLAWRRLDEAQGLSRQAPETANPNNNSRPRLSVNPSDMPAIRKVAFKHNDAVNDIRGQVHANRTKEADPALDKDVAWIAYEQTRSTDCPELPA